MKLRYTTTILTALLGLFLLIPTTACAQKQGNEESKIIQLDAAKFKELVYDYESSATWKYKGDKPCIIDFYADWCGPCRRLKPTLEKIAKDYDGKVIVYGVDVDANEALARVFRVSSIPMTLVVPVEGTPILNTGALPYSDFKKQLDEILSKGGEH